MTKKPKAKAADEGSPLPVEAPKNGKKPKAGVTVEVQAVVHSPAEGPSASPEGEVEASPAAGPTSDGLVPLGSDAAGSACRRGQYGPCSPLDVCSRNDECSANRAVRVHGVHTLNARDNNAVQMRNKRAMTVLHPRLPAKRSRPTSCNHVLTAAVARPITFVTRLYHVFISCVPRVPPAVTRGLNF